MNEIHSSQFPYLILFGGIQLQINCYQPHDNTNFKIFIVYLLHNDYWI